MEQFGSKAAAGWSSDGDGVDGPDGPGIVQLLVFCNMKLKVGWGKCCI
jgi:hypothetical protein